MVIFLIFTYTIHHLLIYVPYSLIHLFFSFAYLWSTFVFRWGSSLNKKQNSGIDPRNKISISLTFRNCSSKQLNTIYISILSKNITPRETIESRNVMRNEKKRLGNKHNKHNTNIFINMVVLCKCCPDCKCAQHVTDKFYLFTLQLVFLKKFKRITYFNTEFWNFSQLFFTWKL